MRKQQIDTAVQDILREQKKTGKLTRTAGALDSLTKVIQAVEVDKGFYTACIKKVMESANPLNALFGLFGYRVIRRDAAKPLVEASGERETALDRMLCLNEDVLRGAVAEIAGVLAEVEAEAEQKNTGMTLRYNDLARSLEEERGKNERLQAASQAKLRMTAERIQYILGLAGPEDDGPVVKQVYELLTDLGLKAYWDAEGAPAGDGAMFSVLKGGGALSGTKPCLMSGDEVLVKGVRFVQDGADTAE